MLGLRRKTMTRLIDADVLCEEFKERQRAALRWKEKANLDGDEERQIRADATLAFLSEVKLTIDKAPTVCNDNYAMGYQDGVKKVLSERPQGEWIPVSERLPEDMQRVLIWFEYYRYGDFNCMYQTYGFGYVCDGEWSPFINGETGWQDKRIIARQPLPEPYKEAET